MHATRSVFQLSGDQIVECYPGNAWEFSMDYIGRYVIIGLRIQVGCFIVF